MCVCSLVFEVYGDHLYLTVLTHSCPTRLSSYLGDVQGAAAAAVVRPVGPGDGGGAVRSAVVPPLRRPGAGGRHARPRDDLPVPRAVDAAPSAGTAACRADAPARRPGRDPEARHADRRDPHPEREIGRANV